MKKEELSLGNIVSYEDIDYTVDGIRDNRVFLRSFKLDAGLEVARVDELDGKIITDAFLIHNGFTQNEHRFFKNYFGHYIMYDIDNNTLSIDCLAMTSKRVVLPDIKYVHQLQNIFTILDLDFKLEF